MHALVYHGKNDLRVEEVPIPEISEDEILVRVGVCGVCPTDIKKIQSGTLAGPRIFGHETAGTIERCGKLVVGMKEGDRVALHHHIPCLRCHHCRHRSFSQCATYKRTGITAGFEPSGGGFAEFARVMPFVMPGVVHIPPNNLLEEGAMLEPVNTVLKGIERLSLLEGDRVWVVGQGPVGLMFTKLLTLSGVEVIASDLLEERKTKAVYFGAKTVLDASSQGFNENLRDLQGDGFDAVIIAVPLDSLVSQGLKSIRGGGKVLLFAHTQQEHSYPIDLGAICVTEKDLIGSYSADVLLQERVAEIVFGRKLDVRELISHRYSLQHSIHAINTATNPGRTTLKVIVKCTECV